MASATSSEVYQLSRHLIIRLQIVFVVVVFSDWSESYWIYGGALCGPDDSCSHQHYQWGRLQLLRAAVGGCGSSWNSAFSNGGSRDACLVLS